MSKQEKQRKKQFIDTAVQGTLLLHIVGHWMFFILAAGALLFFIEMLTGPPRDAWKNMLPRHGPTVLVMLVLTPIFLRDLCKLSNRFTGPMVRLRRAMRDLADGREVSPIHFRERDFWQDLPADFNRVVERVQASTTNAVDDSPTTAAHDSNSPEASDRDEIQEPVLTEPQPSES